MSTTTLETTTMNISGSGFYPSGGASVTITTNAGQTTTFTTTANGSGGITMAITLSQVNGILTASSLSMYATDTFTGDKSNTVTISMQTTTVSPQLVAPTTPIQLLIS